MEAADETAAADRSDEKADVLSGGPTGVAGSDLERRAASRLVEELGNRGRAARAQEVRIPPHESFTLVLHSALVIAATLVALKWPAIGASVCLVATFSFYAERGLGLPLLGRLLPRRRTTNVLSPPPGEAWEEVELVIATGYDVPDSYPVGEWLSGRFSGRLTTDRLLFYGGMIGTFAALMLRVAGIEDTALNVLQTAAAAIPLGVIAAQADRRLAGVPVATQEDLASARELLAAARDADGEGDGDSRIAIAFFGAERASAGGAEAFFGDGRLKLNGDVKVVNLVRAAPAASPQATGAEGDLLPVRMNPELVTGSPMRPRVVALRARTAAGAARRRGVRATTVVARGEAAIDLLLDADEDDVPEKKTTSDPEERE